MARLVTNTVDSGDQRLVRVLCDVPRCLQERAARGQENGRFILSYEWTPEGIVLTLNCPECGGTHTLVLSMPLPCA